MSEAGYSLRLESGYVAFHMERVMPHEVLDQAVSELFRLVKEQEIKKFLLLTDVKFETVDPVRRMEGLRIAENFRLFDRIAVAATDPKELTYLRGSSGLLIMGGFIKDPKNFKHFSDPVKARAWIERP